MNEEMLRVIQDERMSDFVALSEKIVASGWSFVIASLTSVSVQLSYSPTTLPMPTAVWMEKLDAME